MLTSGYEGGFAPVVHAGTAEMQELERASGSEYLGRFVTPEEAAEEIGDRGAEWRMMVDGQPPKIVGGPFTALVVQRSGR